MLILGVIATLLAILVAGTGEPPHADADAPA